MRAFLTADWRYLAMLNYVIDPAVLEPLVPRGTELDHWDGVSYASVVGFLFLDTRVLGVPIPFHRNFEEVNLRFYVRRLAEDGWRRGVVFVKELVPRLLIAAVARRVYNENYQALPMAHDLPGWIPEQSHPNQVAYSWQHSGRTASMKVALAGEPQPLVANSVEEFIAEHYWGYARQRDGGTVEYRVDHPPWRVWNGLSAGLDCDVADLYGPQFAPYIGTDPASAFVAEGSSVTVYRGAKIA